MNLNLRSLRTLWGFDVEFVTDAYLDDIVCVFYMDVFVFENIINYIHYILDYT